MDPRALPLDAARARLKAGDVAAAIPLLEAAYERAVQSGARRLEAEALIELSRALAAQDTIEQALLCLERAAEVAREAGLPDARGEALLCEAQLILPRGDATRAGARLREAVACFDAASSAARAVADPESALGFADRARAARDLLWAAAPPEAAPNLAERALASADARRDEVRRQREASLVSLLFDASRSFLEERDPDRLVDRILDAAIDATGAERGFVLLESPAAPASEPELLPGLVVVAARNFDRRVISKAEFKVSRTVIEQALDSHKPVLVHDAGREAPLSQHTSIVSHRLRSIACLPIETRREAGMRGVLYLDNRFGSGTFEPAHLPALSSFAAHAAVAVENARLHRSAAEQNRQLEAARARAEDLARKLEERLATTGHELAEARARLEGTGRTPPAERSSFGEIAGRSRPMQLLYALLDKVKDADAPVLVLGESGTGKELVARAIHFESPRRAKPFVGENCAALPETLLESTLFGHEPGAFTGATSRRAGLFELAGEGTIFLDEVGDLSAASQAKLLRVLQEKRVRPLGSNVEVAVNPRVIAATHRDLKQMVRDGLFREDLYYRLNVLSVLVPPLRERRDDIPLLVTQLAAREGSATIRISREALRALLEHTWPGNVRELSNEVRRWSAFSRTEVELEDLSPQVREKGTDPGPAAPSMAPVTWKEGERQVLLAALRAARGDRARAAEILALPPGTLWNKLKRVKITDAEIFGVSGA